MGKKIFMDRKGLFTGKLNLELKKQIINCLVWCTALYAAETWTLMQAGRSRLEVFEMWIGEGWRKSVGRTRRQVRKFYTLQEDRKILNTVWKHNVSILISVSIETRCTIAELYIGQLNQSPKVFKVSKPIPTRCKHFGKWSTYPTPTDQLCGCTLIAKTAPDDDHGVHKPIGCGSAASAAVQRGVHSHRLVN